MRRVGQGTPATLGGSFLSPFNFRADDNFKHYVKSNVFTDRILEHATYRAGRALKQPTQMVYCEEQNEGYQIVC